MPSPAHTIAHAHALASTELAKRLAVNPAQGLSPAELAIHRAAFGENRLPEPEHRSRLSVFISQFRSALILVLIGAAILSAAIGNTKDAVIIFTVVLINALVSFFQEYRAEQSLSALKAMLPTQTQVRRSGQKQQIDASELVPGDIVLLEAGDRVPADGRLILAASLEIDESTLTGESLPAAKKIGAALPADTPLAERHTMAYMNTLLTRGRAEMLVTAIGAQTEMGQISSALAEHRESATPLQIQLDVLGKKLGLLAIILVSILALLEWLRGIALAKIIISAIALGVAAIPEGLPVVVTVTLALGMHKMAKQHAIVKRLASVETLGCTTVICSDKTGTLTMNQMRAKTLYYQAQLLKIDTSNHSIAIAAGETAPDFSVLHQALVACNDCRLDGDQHIGDPMEAALLKLAEQFGCHTTCLMRSAEIPFDSAHKYMATFHHDEHGVQIYVKGAPEVLLERCSNTWQADGLHTLTQSAAEMILQQYQHLAQQGQRGLLIASRRIRAEALSPHTPLSAHIDELCFLALIGLQDPPRPEARDAIALCQRAGIAVKMMTGDHPATAQAIAHELQLRGDSISGLELEKLSTAELAERIDQIGVFARMSPAHKVKIVTALQAQGHIVAMTGDGVNDAPALKAADIGVAMGKNGSAVAKEAATMVLTDDDFATIVSAVQQGRALYDNILKFVCFQLSTTIGAILTLFIAPWLGLPAPFTPIQILWIAIIMDGPPAISLALDAARDEMMTQTPRNKAEPVLTPARLSRILAYGCTMTVGTLGILAWALANGSMERAATLAFTTFVLFQFFNVFNARNERCSAFNRHFFSNMMLWLSLLAVLSLQIIAVHWPPAQALFATHGMNWSDWPICIAVASSIWFLEEARKYLYQQFKGYLFQRPT